jgi:copper transport protein
VRWRAISDDGHLESGVLAFRVGAGDGTRPQSVFAAEATEPGVPELASRWLYLAGILVAGGTALFSLLVTSPGTRRAAATYAVALSAVVVGGLVLLHETQAGGTRFGDVTAAAVVVAGVAAATVPLALIHPRVLPLVGVASAALLLAPSLSGHALDAGRPRGLTVTLDLAHVVTAAFWVGGLLQLALLLPSGTATAAARRFSAFALPAVAVLALSGGGRALTELDGVSQLWTTGYGRTLLVKTALFAGLLVLGFVGRRRLASAMRLLRSVSAELALVLALVGAAAVLTALRPGRDAVAAGAQEAAPALVPPRGGLVLAEQSKRLAVGLAVRPGNPLRLTATVVGPTGRGVDGLDVDLAATGATDASRPAEPCGPGCYEAALPVAAPTRATVRIAGAGAPRTVSYSLAESWPPPSGAAFLRRATGAFRSLDSAVYAERLGTGQGTALDTTWKLQAPDRFEYAIRDGAGGIVIGSKRWDRPAPGAPWEESQTTPLPQPSPPWGSGSRDARVLGSTPDGITLSWFDPGIPAWFSGTFDRRTALPETLRMTAAAHFMRQRYEQFDGDVEIAPPR